MRRLLLYLSVSLTLMVLAACAETPTPEAIIVPEAAAATSPALPTISTAAPTAAILPFFSSTNTPAGPQHAVLQTGVNLRTGPGMLFDIMGAYDEGQSVTVLGMAPAGDWYQVQTNDNKTGWMRSAVVTLDGLAIDLPTITPGGVLTIKGHVYTPSKNPASKVGVSLLEKDSNSSPQKDVGNTNAFGEWYIYLPANLTGEWTVRVDSYSCESNTVNSACGLIGHFPPAQTVTLPLAEDTWIDFEMLP